jgi:hypothetical protein
MKKALIIVIAITLLVSVNFVLAKRIPSGKPFQAIWEVINGSTSSSQCPAQCPEGPQGPQGPQGEPGESNWDEDRIAELEERIEILEASQCFLGSVKEAETGLLGICSTGTQTCGEDLLWGEIVPDNEPVDEICDDELDNDCDGDIDELDTDCTA